MGNCCTAETAALKAREEWGSIEAVLNEPLEAVAGDEYWLSVIGMWLFLPINLFMGILGGLCSGVYRTYCWMAIHAVKAGRPFCLAFVWWWAVLGGLVGLGKAKGSRLGLFLWEWRAWGEKEYFFQGTGLWATSYKKVDEILRNHQHRNFGFACIRAVTPDLFPSRCLIFLPNLGKDCEWYAIRHALHQVFLDMGSQTMKDRIQYFKAKVAEEWKNPKIEDLNDEPRVNKAVAKCVFYALTGVWLNEEEAALMAKWREYAGYFVLPRLAQRLLFNLLLKKVKKLRIDTVKLIEKHDLQDLFFRMNELLPQMYRRTPVVRLCDEIVFGLGFAGVGGTCAAVYSVGCFLQLQHPKGSAEGQIDFGDFKTTEDMIAAYKRNPVAYIKETVRLDPPVTSATSGFGKDETVELGGHPLEVPKGMLLQYTTSMANRDPTVFDNPSRFEPNRANLSKAVTWNGAFGTENEETVYPRICPGRFLSIDVSRAILDHVLGLAPGSP